MAGTYLTSGIVLRRRDYKEYDRLYTLYTEDYGKIEAVARGSRKITSKLAGHLEPMSYSSFMLATGRAFDVLATSVRISSFKFPHNDLLAFALANYFFEAVDKLTKPLQADPGIFRVLLGFLYEFDADFDVHGGSPAFQRLLITEYYLFQLLKQLGFAPSMEYCVNGRERLIADSHVISISHGGLICDKHRAEGEILQQLSPQSLEILRLMSDGQLEPLRMMHRALTPMKEIARAINTFLRYHVGDTLASTAFVNALLAEKQ